MALTENVGNEMESRIGELLHFPVKASTHVYKGSLVAIETGIGFAVPAGDTSGHIFVGVATMEADNSSGSNGDIDVIVRRWGIIPLATAGGAQTDVGKTVYCVDDETVDLQGDVTNDIIVGQCVEYVSATSIYVDLKPRYTNADDLSGLAAHITDVTSAHNAEGVDYDDDNTHTAQTELDGVLNEIYAHLVSTLEEVLIPIGLLTREDGTVLTKYATGSATPGFQQLANKEVVLAWDGHATFTPVAVTIPLPPNMNCGADVDVLWNAMMAGATDTPVILHECYFDKGDTDCAGADDEINGGTTLTEYKATIANANVPAAPKALTIIFQPTNGEAGTDETYIHSMGLRYTRKCLAAS